MKKLVMLIILMGLFTNLEAQRKYKKKLKSTIQIETKSETEKNDVKSSPTFRKITLYGSLSRMFMSEDTYTAWDGYYYTFENNNSYYTSQRLIEEKVVFQPLPSIQVGIMKNVALKRKFQISYGLGLEALTFKYKKENSTLDERIIDHIQIVKDGTPDEYEVTRVNDPLVLNDDENYYYYTNSEIEFKVTAIQLPLRLSYQLFPSVYVHAQVGLTMPITTKSFREIQIFNPPNTNVGHINDDNNVKISRAWGQVGVGVQYRVVDQISIFLNYRLNTNSMMVVDNDSRYNYVIHERNSVKMQMIDIGLGLNF